MNWRSCIDRLLASLRDLERTTMAPKTFMKTAPLEATPEPNHLPHLDSTSFVHIYVGLFVGALVGVVTAVLGRWLRRPPDDGGSPLA